MKKEKLSDLKLVAGSEYDFELNKEIDFFSAILTSDANQNWSQQKKELQTNLTDAVKEIKLVNEIFDYIYIAKCQKFFFCSCIRT